MPHPHYDDHNDSSDNDEIHPSFHEEEAEVSFEEDHAILDAHRGEVYADPDSAPITPSNHLHIFVPGHGFIPYSRRR